MDTRMFIVSLNYSKLHESVPEQSHHIALTRYNVTIVEAKKISRLGLKKNTPSSFT